MRIMRIVHWAEDWIPALLLAVMTGLVIVDVTGRYVLNTSFAGTAEIATALFVWLIFLGSSGAVRKLQHIGIEGLTVFIPDRLLPWLQLAISLAIAAVSLHMARIGLNLANASWEREIDMVGVPYFYVYLVIPISFALIALHSALQVVDILRHWEQAQSVRTRTRTDSEI